MWEQEDGDIGPDPVELIPLTPKQKATLDFVKRFIDEHDYPPTVQEVANDAGVTRNAAEHRLGLLYSKGYIVLYANIGRGIALRATGARSG